MMYYPHNRRNCRTRGFALVEVLVYLGITVMIGAALITTFFSLSTALLRNRTDRELTESATVALERMVRTIQSADSVSLTGSSLGTSPGALELSAGATTTRFSVSGGNVAVEENGVMLGPLTSDGVTVQELTFTHYLGATTEMVRVSLTLSASSSAASTTKTFNASAVLRGSYE